MYNVQYETPQCQSPENDLQNTPEHMRPGFRGQPRQYDPREFDLTGNEEWRNPRMFRNMTYDTEAEVMDTFCRAHPRRQGYCQPLVRNLSNLSEECLADMSMPSQMSESGGGEYLANISQPQLCDTEAPMNGDEARTYVDSLYREIIHRFDNLRERIARGDDIFPSEASQASCNAGSMLNGTCDACSSQKNSGGQTTLRKVTTHRDQCGNITSRIEETSTVSNPSDRMSMPCGPMGGTGRRLNFAIPDQSENLENVSMPMLDDDSMPAMSTRIESRKMPNECLNDIHGPTFGDSGERYIQKPVRTIGNILAPSLGTNVCVEDISAPSLAQSTVNISRNADLQEICQDSPNYESTNCECLEDISMPSGVMANQGATGHQNTPLPSECIDNMTMPSFGGISGASNRPAPSMPSECLDHVSAPSFGRSMSRSRTPQHYQRSQQQRSMPTQNICDITAPSFDSTGRIPMRNDCIEDMTMPSFRGISGVSNRQAPTMPCECLEDVSAPSFARSMNRSRTPQSQQRSQQQRSMRSQSICDVTEEYLNGNLSIRGEVSGARRQRSPARQQLNMTSENIYDISAPSFEPISNACIEDITMPSFGGISASSRRKQTMPSEYLNNVSQPMFERSISRGADQRRQNRSMPGQNISDISAPSFDSTRRRPMTNDCIEDITMPSFGFISRVSNRRAAPMSNECLEDVSAPSFTRSLSRSRTSRRQQRSQQQKSLPSHNICDITAPSFGSSGRGPLSKEYLDDISMSICEEVSGAGRQKSQQRSMRSQSICDVTEEYLNGNLSIRGEVSGARRQRSPARQQLNMTSENIYDISAPSFEPISNACIEDITMPSFAEVSGSSRRQHTMPSECLNNVSQPMFERSISRGADQRRQNRSMPGQNICDISASSFESTDRSPMTNECIEDMTMPSFGGISGVSNRRGAPMPSECLEDVSAPSFGRSMSRSRTGRRQQRSQQQRSMPSQNISDITAPLFCSSSRGPATNENLDMPYYAEVSGASRQKSRKHQQRSRRSQNICDVSAPSFGISRRPMTNECLEDVTMPSFDVSGSSRRRQTMPSECFDNVSQQTHGRAISMPRGASPRRQEISAPFSSTGRKPMRNECIEDMTMPSFGGISGVSNRQAPSVPSECLEDVSAPSFGRSMNRSTTRQRQQRSQQQRSMPTENICDIIAPSFESSGRGPITDEYLDDIPMPTFEGISGTSRQRSIARQQQASQNIYDISAPSFGWTECEPMSNGYIDNVSMPSYYNPSESPNRVQGRSLSQGASPRRQRPIPSQNICDISAPTLSSSGRGPMTMTMRMPSECLDDMSAPSFGGRTQNTQQSWEHYHSTQRRPHSDPSYLSECLDNVNTPNFEMNSRDTRGRNQTPNMTSEYLTNVSMPSSMQQGNQLRRIRSFPCISSQQQISAISAPSIKSPMQEIHYSYRNDRIVQRCPDESFPSEMLENVSAPAYASPQKITMPSENLENAIQSNDRNRSRPQEQREDIGNPILASTRINFAPETGQRVEDISAPFGFNKTEVSEPPCSCPAAIQSGNLGKTSTPSKPNETLPKDAKSTGLVKQAPTGQQATNEPSILNKSSQGGSAKTMNEVKEVTIETSTTSVTRIYSNNNETITTITTDTNRIEDISMPSMALSNTNRSRDQNYENINDISMPIYGPSLQSNEESSYNRTNANPKDAYHGFNSMDNYVPFDELVNSTQQQTQQNPTAGTEKGNTLSTPEPVRGNNAKAFIGQRLEPQTEQKKKCSCGSACPRYANARNNNKDNNTRNQNPSR